MDFVPFYPVRVTTGQIKDKSNKNYSRQTKLRQDVIQQTSFQ